MATAKDVLLPDIGDFDQVDVAEVLVSKGDRVEAEQSLIVLESDKASMEIPSPYAGIVTALKVSVGDQVSQGALIAVIEVSEGSADAEKAEAPHEERKREAPGREAQPPATTASAPRDASSETPATLESPRVQTPKPPAPPPAAVVDAADGESRVRGHASPSVRRLARELGVDLTWVPASGRKGRIVAEDVRGYVKGVVAKGTAAGVPIAGVSVAAAVPIDFAKFGPIETQPLNRIRKIAAANLHRSWVTVPHVTQHDEADITDLETFRREMKPDAESRGVKLTFLPFVVKACTTALKEFPQFNASLDPTGENLIAKRYYHIGIAVDTENGLVVPVVHDADRKGLYEIAGELMELSEKARTRKLLPADIQGGSFSISSLGGIGGTFFTPIVNHPEVAVLGVGRTDWRPVHDADSGGFVARRILPLSLSYDHRVIDGADAARFTTRLAELLSDLRRLIL